MHKNTFFLKAMQKRRYTEENEEVREMQQHKNSSRESIEDKLLSKCRLLKEKELEMLTGRLSYPEYFRMYYEVRVKELVRNGLLEKKWNAEKDLWRLRSHRDSFMEFRDFMANTQCPIELVTGNKENLLESELFDKFKGEESGSSRVIMIKNIGRDISINELIEKIEGKVEVEDWAVSQGSFSMNFQRVLYIRTEVQLDDFKKKVSEYVERENTITEQYLPSIDSGQAVKEIGKQFSDKYAKIETERQTRYILLRMSELFGVSEVYKTVSSLEVKVRKEEVGDLYILALRKIFNFCYYCRVKYDNPYEMVFKCGLFHLRSADMLDQSNPVEHANKAQVFERDRMAYLNGIPKEIDVRIFCKDRNNGEIECKYCDKKFQALEFFEKHLQRKNHSEYEMYIKEHEILVECIRSLSYQLVDEIESPTRKIPHEIYNCMQSNEEVYEEELVDYSDLDKKYPVLQEHMPIVVSDFGENEL